MTVVTLQGGVGMGAGCLRMCWEPSKRIALWEGRNDRGLCQLLSVSTIRAQYPGCTTHPVPTLQTLSTGPG